MTEYDVDVLAIGAGPANLALAVALEESGATALAENTLLLEQHPDVKWQRNLLLPWARSQVSFLKDLVTLRNPRSRFSFLNFLHERRQLDEFVNLATFNPYRWELSEYQQWVAHSLERVRVRYGARVQRAEPRLEADGRIVGWTVHLAGGDRISCRDLVFGTGRDPHVPDVFASLPGDRIVHSTRYCSRIAEFDGDKPLRPVVVGGAQSAAEMFMAVHTDLPGAAPTMVVRSIGLQNYQTSKFVNELFYSSFVDEFYYSEAEARRRILDEMHLTNYAGLAPPFLDELYSMLYRQKMLGQQRSRILPMTDVVAARMDGDEVVLDLRDLRSGRIEPMRCDLVLLGTGYSPEMPALVRDLADRIGLPGIEVTRRYRMELGGSARGAVYLQGVNEATHGISDTLISVLAHRSQDIVDDLLDRRTELRRRPVAEVRTA
ncbi:SidA/IucD/PvdA family monooxygenase [Nocardia wallacei]|uniref:SidA/IucD/PvdA family monooxygenase n=1 Tax=Nocardia wallacei TaxID=480035 RepID=UPI002455D926|nr:SidA/IucD/PvdA family monooxygenase [Nocardia wallacei]